MLKEGDKAPAFDLENIRPDGSTGRLSMKDFGDKTLVLYFYPRDNTPGCTRQAQGFTAARKAIEAAGAAVVGVSRDSIKSHQSFRTKCNLGIDLLSDPDLKLHKAYGAWGTKKMYGRDVEGVLRTTFVIDHGKVTRVFPNVKVDGHADAVLAALKPSTQLANEGSMAAKKKKSSSKKSAVESIGEKAAEVVANAVGKVAKAIAPAKKKAKAAAKKAGAKVKKAAAKVKKKAGGAKKKKAASKKK